MRLLKILRFFVILIGLTTAFLYWPLKGPMEAVHIAAFEKIGDAFFGSRFWWSGDAHAAFVNLHDPDRDSEVIFSISDVFKVYNPKTGQIDQYPMPTNLTILPAENELDMLIICMHRKAMRRMIDAQMTSGSPFGQIRISSRITGYWPLAFIFALVLAKPYPTWGRRFSAIVLGLILIEIFVLMRLSIFMLDVCYADPEKSFAIFHPSEWFAGLIDQAKTLLVDNPTLSFVAPVLVWLLVAVTKSEWAVLFRLLGAMTDEEEEEWEIYEEEAAAGDGS
ncbi:MAG: hypothetical protein ACPGXK_17170 [Phycisphaerae bacterium]